jgi:hypothetical protein
VTDQFEVRSALKTMAMVGRTSETSAISMRPVRKEKSAGVRPPSRR